VDEKIRISGARIPRSSLFAIAAITDSAFLADGVGGRPRLSPMVRAMAAGKSGQRPALIRKH
jgi:hypothetical protein